MHAPRDLNTPAKTHARRGHLRRRRPRQRSAWTPVRSGVDLVGGAPATPQRTVMEAILAMGPRAVASHMTALWLHGLRADAPQQVHVTVDGATRRRLA